MSEACQHANQVITHIDQVPLPKCTTSTIEAGQAMSARMYGGASLKATACCRREPMSTMDNAQSSDTSDDVESTSCSLCHMVVSYVRAALEDKQTDEEIEQV